MTSKQLPYSKKTLFVLVGELVTFNASIGFNVRALPRAKNQSVKSTVGLDVPRNEATGVKSHIFGIYEKNEQDVVGLFCQITGERPCCSVLCNHLL